MSLLEEMVNTSELENGRKGRVLYVDIDEIKPNKDNVFKTEMIDELAENIHDEGLLQPLIVYKDNVLHTGHRRLKALQKLIEDNKNYSYFGKDITGQCAVIYIDKLNDDELDKKISLIRSNSYRQYSSEEKNNLIDIVYDYVLVLEMNGKKEKGRTRDIISGITGISAEYIKKYLAQKNKPEEEIIECDNAEDQPIEDVQEVDINKQAKKLIKMMRKLQEELESREFEKRDLSRNVKSEFSSASSYLIDIILKIR